MREEMLIELSHARSLSRRVTESCKWILAVMVVIVVQMAFAMSPTITSVTAQQRYPWNGKVDISYTVTGDIAAEAKQQAVFTSLKVSAIDLVSNVTNTATQLSGDLSLEEGTHAVVWDMDAEGLQSPFRSSNIVIRVSCVIKPAMYCVVDLSAGPNALIYPVSYLENPPEGGFNSDDYKTTKLVLRRIEPGSFLMGGMYNVSLSKAFFCGVFEITQKQYSLVTGSNPSLHVGDMRPVDRVSYDMIRGSVLGAQWPSLEGVDSTSFLGKLRARTGIDFDLPTEGQWEYACRAGTTSNYNNGGETEDDLREVGRYSGNQVDGKGGYSYKHTVVGSYAPNEWGLYDMHGNDWEWCLDWNGDLSDNVVDPSGAISGTERIARGGCWGSSSAECCSHYRGPNRPSVTNGGQGFRLARMIKSPENTQSVEGLSFADSGIIIVDVANHNRRTTTNTERIRYSTDWVSGAASDAMAVVAVDGVTLKSATGTGYVDWTPDRNGTYTLTHTVMSGGSQVGETLTATLVVEGLNPEEPVISPDSRTTFEGSLSVSMSCPTEGATIHYTTNGIDPTMESTEYHRFKIYGKTTVKAIAEKDGMLSDVVTAEYALGQCEDPVILPTDGTEFMHPGLKVTINYNDDGVLRYTLDGSEPTAESPIYEGSFSVSESVVVKAKVFSDRYFDSAVVTVTLTRVRESVATPDIDAESSFMGSKTKVSISCATGGAVVRYTLDGNEPNSHSTKYTGPFYVTDNCTVKAYAMMPDYLNSEVATFAIEKVWVIGDTMGKPDHGFTTSGDGDKAFYRVEDVSAPNGEAMKSGAIGNSSAYGTFARTVLSTTVMGPGMVSFSWKASCEDDAPEYEWDHGEFAVDGVVKAYVSGEAVWTNVSVAVTGPGEHMLTWTYLKDDAESEGEDCILVANYSWASAETYTHTTQVHVPYAWLLGHDPEIVDEYDAYEAAAKVTGANGHKVWESYVIGADPNDKDDMFRITAFPMKADGTPDLEAITIAPSQSKWNVEGAQPVLKGKATLEGAGEWQTVTEENKADIRFFKVEVVVP